MAESCFRMAVLVTLTLGVAPAPGSGGPEAKLAEAHALFRRQVYARARDLFRQVAEQSKAPAQAAEEARYYEAECLRLRGFYPRAAVVYQRVLSDFPRGAFRARANKHLFDIADHWLDDLRQEMRQQLEVREGRRLLVFPNLIHLDRTRPLFGEEMLAIQTLEQVYRNDPDGPLADNTLFLMGYVHFYREDHAAADRHFSTLVRRHPKSVYAPKAIEYAVYCKVMTVPEGEDDGGKLAEARALIETFRRDFPQVAPEKKEYLARQCYRIQLLEAQRDFRAAECRERAGDLDLARSGYQEVCRRHAGTRYAEQARQRLEALRKGK